MRLSLKILRLVLVAALVGAGLWWLITRGPRPRSHAEGNGIVQANPGTDETAPPVTAAAVQLPRDTNLLSMRPQVPGGAVRNSPGAATHPEAPYILGTAASLPTNIAPQSLMENMRSTLRNYGSTFQGNPTGNNQEITRQLSGDNPKHINFLKEDAGMRINGNGELVDAWGTPFFFHQLSAQETEIRSAGPDREMWTSDDIIIK